MCVTYIIDTCSDTWCPVDETCKPKGKIHTQNTVLKFSWIFAYTLFVYGELKIRYTKDNKYFPSMEDVLKLHQEEEHYLMIAKEFVRIIVGKAKWKHQCFRDNLSKFCSASGEAFCLLTLENNYARWCGMVESGDFGDKNHTAPPPLYTNAGKTNRNIGMAKPFQGWSVEGYERFNELHRLVKHDRAKKTREDFEDRLRAILAEENSKRRKTKIDEEDDGEEVVYPAHDFADVVSGGIRGVHSDSNDDATDDEEVNDTEIQLKEGKDNNEESSEEDEEPDYTSEQNTHHSDDDEEEDF
jgi:hypothetical protein